MSNNKTIIEVYKSTELAGANMIFNTYRKKLIAIFVVIAMVPTIIIALGINLKVEDEIVKNTIRDKAKSLEHEVEKVDIWFQDKEKTLETASNNYSFLKDIIGSENSKDRLRKYLNTQILNNKEFLNLYIALEDGTDYFSIKGFDPKVDTKNRPWYRNAKLAGGPIWTQPYRDMITNEKVITLSTPIYDNTGNFQGVVGADFKVETIVDTIKNINTLKDSSTYLVGPTEKIYKVIGKDILAKEDDEKVKSFLDYIKFRNYGQKEFEIGKGYISIHSTISSIRWKVASITPKEYFYGNTNRINKYLALALVLTLILALILAIIVSRIFSRSLDKLIEGTREIQDGNYNYKINLNNNDEFGQLAEGFNTMAATIRDKTKELIENNSSLQEMNIELEASYEQLEATTDQLNESESRYRSLIENMDEIVWVIDNNFNIEFLNDKINDMMGYCKNQLIGKNFNEIIRKCGDLNYDLLEQIKEEDLKNYPFICVNKKGKEIITEISTNRIYESNRLVAIQGVIRDVTNRSIMEKEIIRRNNELSTINKISKTLNSTMDLETLLKNMTRDIVNMLDIPLCSIRLLTENNKLKPVAHYGELSNIVSEDNIGIDEDVIGEAVRKGKIVVLNKKDKKKMNKYNKGFFSKKSKVNFANIIPIKNRNEVLGVMLIATKEPVEKSELNITLSLSNQMAMVIDNINLYQDLKEGYIKTIKTLAAAVEAKDKYTEGHSLRVSKYSKIISRYMGFSNEFCDEIEFAGILHDIGKIGISDTILGKPGALTDQEYEIITKHPTIGSNILENTGFSNIIMNSIKYHHKRYDLKGYPKEDNIEPLPIEACIVGVADAFDAMTSSRSYRKAMDFEVAIKELQDNKGTQFHPDVVDVVIKIFKEEKESIKEIATTKI
ncbi:HD domain-containing phosphohydrolase [Dethiothermospora halolimnae]|uniref:HD domain-containing phosphohydrolase n=1 Tax=Dethiothermospora halolimnae TaxID=3114390 RepID=UPI003CCC2B09